MKLPLLLIAIALVSCETKKTALSDTVNPTSLSAEELKAKRNRDGWTYLRTQGEQREEPYVHLGTQIGVYGWTFHVDSMKFSAPDDGLKHHYLAAAYRNSDGSIFMNIYRGPEGKGFLNQGRSDNDRSAAAESASE